jgi:hypothetical protein
LLHGIDIIPIRGIRQSKLIPLGGYRTLADRRGADHERTPDPPARRRQRVQL